MKVRTGTIHSLDQTQFPDPQSPRLLSAVLRCVPVRGAPLDCPLSSTSFTMFIQLDWNSRLYTGARSTRFGESVTNRWPKLPSVLRHSANCSIGTRNINKGLISCDTRYWRLEFHCETHGISISVISSLCSARGAG